MADKPQPGKPTAPLNNLVYVEQVAQLALALPIGCGLGWLLGSWADRQWHLHWVVLVGILLGAAGGFIQIFTTFSRMMKRGDETDA